VSDAPDAADSPPASRPASKGIRDLIRGEGMREQASGRHAIHPVALANLSDIALFVSATEELFRPPDDLEPWDPAEGEDVPWELRDEDDGS
jgi:hypothetical protein